jgi:aryl-alcohol dehydrogenase-like predicted oxidoreductase
MLTPAGMSRRFRGRGCVALSCGALVPRTRGVGKAPPNRRFRRLWIAAKIGRDVHAERTDGMFHRTLGRSGIEVSALGLGCWAIGGPYVNAEGQPCGWGQIDDDESIRAIHRGLELGISFFDTAACYGCGHSERVLGKALPGRRDGAVIATKFWHHFDEKRRIAIGPYAGPEEIAQACEDSLRRLNTDRIDLYQFHQGNCPAEQAPAVRDACEGLVEQGKIRAYGWSTDDPARAAVFAEGPHCTAIQQRLSIFEGNLETLALCERQNLASVNRGPLCKGLLTGKFTHETTWPADDIRSNWWNVKDGREGRWIDQLEQIRDVLTSDGRTLAQAALGWIWARSERTIPIPGFKSVAQVEENAKSADFGPLSGEQMQKIAHLLAHA